MKNKKLIALTVVFIVAVVIAIPLSIYLSSSLSIFLHQNDACFYPNPAQYCIPIQTFPQWEQDDFNHASAIGLALLWLGIGVSGVLSATVFRRLSLSTARKWSILSIGLVIAVLLPLLTWRAIINATYIYACALSLPIGLVSIILFLVPQTAQHTVSQQMKEPAKQDEKLLSLQQAVRDDPQSFQAWTDLAYRQHKLDLNNDALTSANKALQLISENKSLEEEHRKKAYARAWFVRGAALSTMDNQEDKALQALKRALQDDPENVDALYYTARVFMFQGENDDAHRLFDNVIRLDTTYKDAYVGKNILYLAVNDFNSVLAIADKYIGQFPDDPVGWRMQGVAYTLQGEAEWDEEKIEQAKASLHKAIKSFNIALELDPTDGSIYLVKAAPFVDLGDYSQAIDVLNQGLKFDPGNTELQEEKKALLHKRRARIAGRVGRKAGSMALGGGKGLAKGSFQAGKLFWKEIFKN